MRIPFGAACFWAATSEILSYAAQRLHRDKISFVSLQNQEVKTCNIWTLVNNKIAKAMKGKQQLELKLANEPSVEAEAALKARKHKSHKKKGGAKKPVASQPYNPDNLKKAVDAGQLGEACKTVLEFQNKMAEFIKLQQALKAAGSEEEKNRLGAEIEKKKAELEELKKKLQASGGKG
jgi:hypothetical protein